MVNKDLPVRGDTFRCSHCGMELVITADCQCDKKECVCFTCCEKEMAKKATPLPLT